MSFKKNLMGSLGFTLVEALAAMGVLGVIALAIVNQGKMVQNSRISSSADTALSALRDRIVVALSNERTCTANFSGLAMNGTVHIVNNIRDSENANIISSVAGSEFYGGSTTTTKMTALEGTNTIKIREIALRAVGSNFDQAELWVRVYKKTGSRSSQGLASFDALSKREEFMIPLNIVKSGGNLSYCFTDATMSIATAIRLSCKGNTAFYDENLNPPYGACVHIAQHSLPTCTSGQFIRRIGINLSALGTTDNRSAAIQYECQSLSATCPVGQVITGTNADGTFNCAYPLPNCAAGQLMVMNSAGRYTCLNTNVGCAGLNAVKSFNADGSVSCARFYAPASCAGFVQSISPTGAVTCSENVQPVNCPFGQFVKSVDASGNPICSPWVNFPANCPAGQGAYGLDSNGNILCQPLDIRTSCYGSSSPTGRTFSQCIAGGGTVVNRYVPGSTHSYCIFNAAVCPGGWSACNQHRTTINNSCTDTNSNCSYSVSSRTAPGTYAFTDAAPASTTCYAWMRNSGPWVRSCTPVALAPTFATSTQVGCY